MVANLQNQEKIGRSLKNILVISFLIVASVVLSQTAKVTLTITPTSVEVGESFVISITSNVQGDVDIENLPGSFLQDYSIQQGNYPEMDHNTGKITNIYFLSYSGVITKAGDYTIGPAFVKNGNKVYKSNSVKMKVGKQLSMSSSNISATQLSDPAFGVIEVSKKEIYEGEPVVLAAKIYSHYEPTNIGGYISYQINSAVLKNSIGNNNSIQVNPETVKGKKLFAFTYDKNVIFPDGVGKFQVDPFKVKLYQGYKSFPITSSGLTINVKPLPSNPPADFIGAVGEFRITRSIDTNSTKQGDVIKMTVVVSGIGNLQNISKPKLNLPSGFVIYGDPVVNENVVIGIHGGEGEVSFEYNIQINKFGQLKIPETTISYFDPEKEKYVQTSTTPSTIKVEQNKQYVVQNTEIESKENAAVLERDLSLRTQSEIYSNNTFYKGPLFWTGVSLPLFASIMFLLFAKRKEENAEVDAAKKVKRNKKSELNSILTELKSIDLSDGSDRYFGAIELAIKKSFEIKMNLDDDRMPSKNEILAYCGTSDLHELIPTIEEILTVCEQSRYGFGASGISKSELDSKLEVIFQKLKI